MPRIPRKNNRKGLLRRIRQTPFQSTRWKGSCLLGSTRSFRALTHRFSTVAQLTASLSRFSFFLSFLPRPRAGPARAREQPGRLPNISFNVFSIRLASTNKIPGALLFHFLGYSRQRPRRTCKKKKKTKRMSPRVQYPFLDKGGSSHESSPAQ